MLPQVLTLAAVVGNLNAALDFVDACADLAGLLPKKKAGLLVAVEEVFVNVSDYAYPDGSGSVELKCELSEAGFTVEISDEGSPFDVLSLSDPDITQDLEEREIGGLGVYLVRQFTDEVTYRRENGRNVLRLLLYRQHCEASSS